MALRAVDRATGRPKPLLDCSVEELQPWFAERMASLRAHPCTCDRTLAEEALSVARHINSPREVEWLEKLIASFDNTTEVVVTQ